ncbi:hypothetical protein GH714_010933 [Hevea brasiliensis]|uniref:Uncharacterized protein n=1 Tax=Hevea brasiliensis TaxID=3981 RepID=A0A6A6LKU3_HEVBR|nr:hypothetical protein GH714_010933 [Hevea brasiliensis]
MYNNVGAQPGAPRPPTNPQPNPFGNAFYGAGSGLIRGGLGAYGEKILGSSSEYVQSNGHWTRITEPVGGRLSYKPQFMIKCTRFVHSLHGIWFSPEALNWLFVKGLLGWFMQVALLKVTLLSLGSERHPYWTLLHMLGILSPGCVWLS